MTLITRVINNNVNDFAEMSPEDVETVKDGEEMEQEIEEEEDTKQISLKVLSLIKEAQQKHGLRHADYQRYRGYCSRRLRRIRKAVGLVQGEKKKFNKKFSYTIRQTQLILSMPPATLKIHR